MADRKEDPQIVFLRKRVELERESFSRERERYEDEIEKSTAAMRHLKSDLHVAEARVNDLEMSLGDIHRLKAIAAEYEALGGSSILDRFQELATKCRSLEMDNSILQAFHDKDQERIVQLDAHNSELARKLTSLDDYPQIKRELSVANEKLRELSGTAGSHDVVVSTLHEDYLRLQREQSSLQIELLLERKKSERLMVTVDMMELDLKRSDQSLNSLAPDVEILKYEAEGFKQKAAEASVRADNELWLHEETRSHLQRVESTAAQLEVQVGVLALQCEALQESLNNTVAENKSLQDQIISRSRALESLVDERERLMLELADIYAIGPVQEVIEKAQAVSAAQLELSNLRIAFHGQYFVSFMLCILHPLFLKCTASDLEAEHEDARRKILEDAQSRFQVQGSHTFLFTTCHTFVHHIYSAIKPTAGGFRHFRQVLATNFLHEPLQEYLSWDGWCLWQKALEVRAFSSTTIPSQNVTVTSRRIQRRLGSLRFNISKILRNLMWYFVAGHVHSKASGTIHVLRRWKRQSVLKEFIRNNSTLRKCK